MNFKVSESGSTHISNYLIVLRKQKGTYKTLKRQCGVGKINGLGVRRSAFEAQVCSNIMCDSDK